eukprot:TRINITY_DN4600_c0_g1_i1.p2 TRINITY_DN4600_c0_g1~~TRINITY_DN4600_c0_g1_i1.p2  ORF type:complete len:54 (+),score=22.38 TRINITY_DN4600_c0_g1_i1:180-341(+)
MMLWTRNIHGKNLKLYFVRGILMKKINKEDSWIKKKKYRLRGRSSETAKAHRG